MGDAVMMDPTKRRVGQLVRLLSSDKPGEVNAAAAALNRTLATAGLDIHQLADIIEAGLPQASKQPKPPATVKARRPDGRPLTMGEQLICDAPDGLFRPCGCGGVLFEVMAGVGPHAAQLVCTACHRGGRWLARRYFEVAS
jgi:hypothetical protein